MEEFRDVIGLFFDVDSNRFIDENGVIVFDIYEIITPKDVLLFKQVGEWTNYPFLTRHRSYKGVGVELYYPDDGWDEMEENTHGNFKAANIS